MDAKNIVNSIPELLNKIQHDTKNWTNNCFAKPWFRGHSYSEYKLIPSVLRKGNHKNEFEITTKFRLLAQGFINITDPRRLDNMLFLMQHHGVPTRLLDWTENPLFALLFALLPALKLDFEITHDASIYCLDPIALNELSVGSCFPNTWKQSPVLQTIKFAFGTQNEKVWLNGRRKKIRYLEKPVAIYPSTIHSRLKDQKGCFTLHGSDNRCISEICRDNLVKEGKLIKYTIPSDSVKELLAELYDMGITYSSIFQDLDGLAKDLKYQFKMKEC